MEMYGARALKDRLRSESLASLNSATAAQGMEGYVPNEARGMGAFIPNDARTKGFMQEAPIATPMANAPVAYSPRAMQESEARAQMSTRFAPRGPGLPFGPGVRSLASIMQTDWPESTPRVSERPYVTGGAGQSPNLQDWKQGFATGAPANQMGLKVPYIKFD